MQLPFYLALATAALAAPLNPIQQLLAPSAADLISFAQAESTMHALGPAALEQLTDKGKERLRQTLQIVEINHLRAELDAQQMTSNFAASAMGEDGPGEDVQRELEGEEVMAHPPTPAPAPAAKATKRPRQAVSLQAATEVMEDPQTPSTPSAEPPLEPKTRSLPRENLTPFFHSLKTANEGLTSSSFVPLHIQGEDETSVCTESISWMSLPNSDRHEGFWIVPIESMRINGLDMEGPFDGAIFDAASNRLGIPPFLAEQLYGFVAFASPVPSTTESSSAVSYSYPCSETVEFSITFADTVHSLTPKEFNITPLASIEGDYCLGAVYGLGLLSVEVEEARHRRGEVLS